MLGPPLGVQQPFNRNHIPGLRGALRRAELDFQKKRLVHSFYNEVKRAYGGLRLEGRIDYEPFGINDDSKTLYSTLAIEKSPWLWGALVNSSFWL